jgi:hypothetical protein
MAACEQKAMGPFYLGECYFFERVKNLLKIPIDVTVPIFTSEKSVL